MRKREKREEREEVRVKESRLDGLFHVSADMGSCTPENWAVHVQTTGGTGAAVNETSFRTISFIERSGAALRPPSQKKKPGEKSRERERERAS